MALVAARPRGGLLLEALRLLPDLLRLLPGLAADRSLPRSVRVGLVLLLGYLALPFDLVPDFIPVLGYADDAIIVAAVLRWVVLRAGVHGALRAAGREPRTGLLSCAVWLDGNSLMRLMRRNSRQLVGTDLRESAGLVHRVGLAARSAVGAKKIQRLRRR